jgi:hypothetical protein
VSFIRHERIARTEADNTRLTICTARRPEIISHPYEDTMPVRKRSSKSTPDSDATSNAATSPETATAPTATDDTTERRVPRTTAEELERSMNDRPYERGEAF